MEMYSADDVANAVNNVLITVLAPIIATHPSWEALYDRYTGAIDSAEGDSDPAVSLARVLLGNLVDAIDREIAAGSSPD